VINVVGITISISSIYDSTRITKVGLGEFSSVMKTSLEIIIGISAVALFFVGMSLLVNYRDPF
tara:strand:- start:236 stop:424 length:189 start_codon:yes stop_codon:yes gene_type:complete